MTPHRSFRPPPFRHYAGASTYLLATKYNNYGGRGTGTGQNRMAILDPSAARIDPISGASDDASRS